MAVFSHMQPGARWIAFLPAIDNPKGASRGEVEAKDHARTAVGTAGLPLGMPVEIAAEVEIPS
jgi:enamine deaminase RidA (YjgF/YER057c/UK114 family)